MRGVHHRLGGRLAAVEVVAVEADVDVAERHRLADQLGHQVAQPRGQHGAATVDPHDREPCLAARLLDDLVCDPHQRAPHVLAVEDRLLAQGTAPSWPLGTGLKEPAAETSSRLGRRRASTRFAECARSWATLLPREPRAVTGVRPADADRARRRAPTGSRPSRPAWSARPPTRCSSAPTSPGTTRPATASPAWATWPASWSAPAAGAPSGPSSCCATSSRAGRWRPLAR